jgi:hypothetical protein
MSVGHRRIQKRKLGGGQMASAVARGYSGGLGARPPVGSRGFAPGGGSGGLCPPEADDILLLTDLILMLKM